MSEMSDPSPGFPSHNVDSPQKITGFIQVLPCNEAEKHIIYYGPQDLSTRIISGIIFSVFGGVFSGVPLYFGIRGWSKLFERPMDETGYLVGGALLIGVALLIYFGREILWTLFGKTFFVASKQGLEIRKEFLFLSTRKFIDYREIKQFVLDMKRVSGSKTSRSSSWYTLSVLGRKKISMASKTPSRESVVWLGKTLSGWFGVPFESSH